MDTAKNIRVYSGSAHPQLSRDIADYLGLSLGRVHLERFPDGEICVQFEENVRRSDVFLIQPTCSPVNENLMELLGSLTQGYVKPEQPVQQPTLLSGLKRQIKKWIT